MVSKTNKTLHAKPRSPRIGSARQTSRGKGPSLPFWVLGLVGIVFLSVAIFAGVVLYQVVKEFVATGPFAVATVPTPQPEGSVEPLIVADPEGGESPIVNPDNPASLPEGVRPTDRVTILVMGTDRECVHIDEPRRSDTMILLTVDPLSNTAGMLSIPRDLWVPIPGFGNNRINTAFRSGEVHEYPGGGPALAVETVKYNLGIHINYYVTVNYDAFIQAVDLIGGIELDVPETINDPDYPDPCYGIDPFFLSAGHQYLDGATALKYARTRATFGADFDRAVRQQAVVMAVWDKVLKQNVSLLTRAPELWVTFQENVTTNMTYQEVIGLSLLVMEIPPENIYRAVIDYNYVRDYTAPDGAQVLIPIRERIRELRDAFLSSTVVPTPAANPAEAMRAEAARILVLNGTWTNGLAGSTAEYLESLGFSVAGVDDAEEKGQSATQIIDYAGKTATVDYLAEILQVSPGSIYGGPSSGGEYDIKLILGADWQVPSE